MMNDDSRLDDLFRRYRASCPDPEPVADFMPKLWQKIDARHNFWFVFQRSARAVMTASAALCVLLVVLNIVSSTQNHTLAATYVDALMADHTAEKTYYTEAIRITPVKEESPAAMGR